MPQPARAVASRPRANSLRLATSCSRWRLRSRLHKMPDYGHPHRRRDRALRPPLGPLRGGRPGQQKLKAASALIVGRRTGLTRRALSGGGGDWHRDPGRSRRRRPLQPAAPDRLSPRTTSAGRKAGGRHRPAGGAQPAHLRPPATTAASTPQPPTRWSRASTWCSTAPTTSPPASPSTPPACATASPWSPGPSAAGPARSACSGPSPATAAWCPKSRRTPRPAWRWARWGRLAGRGRLHMMGLEAIKLVVGAGGAVDRAVADLRGAVGGTRTVKVGGGPGVSDVLWGTGGGPPPPPPPPGLGPFGQGWARRSPCKPLPRNQVSARLSVLDSRASPSSFARPAARVSAQHATSAGPRRPAAAWRSRPSAFRQTDCSARRRGDAVAVEQQRLIQAPRRGSGEGVFVDVAPGGLGRQERIAGVQPIGSVARRAAAARGAKAVTSCVMARAPFRARSMRTRRSPLRVPQIAASWASSSVASARSKAKPRRRAEAPRRSRCPGRRTNPWSTDQREGP